MPLDALARATDSTADRPTLLQVAARAVYPEDYLAELERLPVPLLRACLADLAHLMLPVLRDRADRLQMTVTKLVENQISLQGTQTVLYAIGATTVVDMQTGSLPSASEDFRKFAAAIGAPPRLPGLTAAETQIYQGARQLANLAYSSRLGVGLASLAVTERVWQWMCTLIGDLLRHREAVVSMAAQSCFMPQRRDAKVADELQDMVIALPATTVVDRGIGFGADQAVQVLTPLFGLLRARQLQLGQLDQ